MGEKFRLNARQRNTLPVLQPGRMYGSWIGDGEVNYSLPTPLAIVQHDAQRQTRSGRFAVVVPQDAADSLAALDLTGVAADFLARIDQSVVEALVIALCVIMACGQNTQLNRNRLKRLGLPREQ